MVRFLSRLGHAIKSTACIVGMVLLVAASANAFVGQALRRCVPQGTTAVCAEDYTFTTARTSYADIARYNVQEFSGYVYVPPKNECLCELDFEVWVITGTLPASYEYYAAVYALNGSNGLQTLIGRSNPIAGNTLTAFTWLSSGTSGNFTFSTCLNMSSGVSYGVAFFLDSDSDPTDDPEIDGVNFPSFGYVNGSSGDSIQGGRTRWSWSSSLPYVQQFTDPTDDLRIKHWTQ